MWFKFALSINKLKEITAAFSNRFSGICAYPNCPHPSKEVGKMEGICEKDFASGRFLCFHNDCFQKMQAERYGNQRQETPQQQNVRPLPRAPLQRATSRKFILSSSNPDLGIILIPGFSWDLLNAFKLCLKGARFQNEFEGYEKPWIVPFNKSSAKHIIKTLRDLGFEIDPAAEEKANEHSESYDALVAKGMYDFQAEDIDWLSQQNRALVAHEMGLGKTAISLMALPKDRGAIVVCPASLIYTAWAEGIQQWVPEFKIFVVKNAQSFRFPKIGEIVITSYERISDDFIPPETTSVIKGRKVKYKDFDALDEDLKRALSNVSLIVDEAHYVKKPKTRRSIKVRSLCRYAASSWMLTGTPLANRPEDLRGLLTVGDMLKDTFRKTTMRENGEEVEYSSYDLFNKLMGAVWGNVPIKSKKEKPKDKSDENSEEEPEPVSRSGGRITTIVGWGTPSPLVPGILGKVMIRRKKEETLTGENALPPKDYSNIVVDIDDPSLSQELDTKLQEWIVAAQEENQEFVVNDEYGEVPSGLPSFEEFSKIRKQLAVYKTDAAIRMVEDFEQRRKPLVVFSAHVDPIEMIGSRPGWAMIHGATKSQERAQIVANFQNGMLKGVAATIGAGGVGLTLTRAADTLFVDMAWTPGDNSQAEDRIHRIGQKAKEINIMRLLVNHPMDIHICKLLDMKEKWIASAIDGRVNALMEQGGMTDEDPEIIVNGETKKLGDCTEEEIRLSVYQQLGAESGGRVQPENLQEVSPTQTEMVPPSESNLLLSTSKKSMIWRSFNALLERGISSRDANFAELFIAIVEHRQQQSGNWNPILNISDDEFRRLQKILDKYPNIQPESEYPMTEEPQIESEELEDDER